MCHNILCGSNAAICYYSAESSGPGSPILEITLCLDSSENVLERFQTRRENILGSMFSSQHIEPLLIETVVRNSPEISAEVLQIFEDSEESE